MYYINQTHTHTHTHRTWVNGLSTYTSSGYIITDGSSSSSSSSSGSSGSSGIILTKVCNMDTDDTEECKEERCGSRTQDLPQHPPPPPACCSFSISTILPRLFGPALCWAGSLLGSFLAGNKTQITSH